MAGKKGSKYFDFFLSYEINLKNSNLNNIIKEKTFKLLESIQNEKSLVAAAKKCNITFRTAWTKINDIEKQLGFQIVVKSRGGEHGGTSFLTNDGLKLLEAYEHLRKEFDISVKQISKTFFNTINT